MRPILEKEAVADKTVKEMGHALDKGELEVIMRLMEGRNVAVLQYQSPTMCSPTTVYPDFWIRTFHDPHFMKGLATYTSLNHYGAKYHSFVKQ